jgi:hypothetical protein
MKRDRKGILLTLATLILVILMFAEVFTYVSLNISGNRLTTQLSESESVSAIGTKAGLEIRAFLHNEMLTDIDIIDTRGISANNIANRTSTASAVKALLTGKNSTIVNMSTYINSIEQQAKIEGKNLSIVNRTLMVFQVSPLLLKATYTALAVVNVDGINSTYPINVNVTVPSASLFAQVYIGNLPPSIRYYVPVTITNTQNVPTSAPFQQKVNINSSLYKAYEAGNLNNIEFFYQNYTTVPSWLESGNSNTSTNTTYWLKLAQEIPAQSSITIYMGFANMTTNLFNNLSTGEAPQLSPTYAQYDDGTGMFNFYDNFAGSSLNTNNWYIVSGMNYTVNNGFTYRSTNTICNDVFVTSVPSFASPYVIDFYGNGATNDDMGLWFNAQGRGTSTDTNLWAERGTLSSAGPDALFTGNPAPTTFTEYAPSAAGEMDGNNHIYTLIDGLTNNPVTAERDYSAFMSTASFPTNYASGYLGPRSCGGNEFWQWIRVRAYPPNGVMPKVSVGSVG